MNNRHLFTKIKKPHPSQIETGNISTTMFFDSHSHVHENFTIWFSILSPFGDPLGKLHKFSYLLGAKNLLALSTPSDDEPLQHTVVDDYIEVIQDLIVYPLLEQDFMSTMGPYNRVQPMQALAESHLFLLATAPIPYVVTSAASLLEPIQSFCAQPSIISPKVIAHNSRLCTNVYHDIHKALVGNTGALIMELELVFTHWHFTPTWNGRHLDDIIPHNDCIASHPAPTPTAVTSLPPIDIPTSTMDPPIPPIELTLCEGRATPPTVPPTFASIAPASSMPTTSWIPFALCLAHVALILSHVFHLFRPGCRGNRVPPDQPNIQFFFW